MIMDLIITENGRKLAVVKPVASLMHSKLIRDVIASGRKFVVDLDTGQLTIYGKTTTESRFPVFHFLRNGDKVYDLPNKWSQETEDQLYELYLDTANDGESFVYYGEDRTIRVVVQGSWRGFKENVERYYKMF
jgi:hypothetical protein